MGRRAESLADRIEEGAVGLAAFAEVLSEVEWRTPASGTDASGQPETAGRYFHCGRGASCRVGRADSHRPRRSLLSFETFGG
jgi:hypothetical protein